MRTRSITGLTKAQRRQSHLGQHSKCKDHYQRNGQNRRRLWCHVAQKKSQQDQREDSPVQEGGKTILTSTSIARNISGTAATAHDTAESSRTRPITSSTKVMSPKLPQMEELTSAGRRQSHPGQRYQGRSQQLQSCGYSYLARVPAQPVCHSAWAWPPEGLLHLPQGQAEMYTSKHLPNLSTAITRKI